MIDSPTSEPLPASATADPREPHDDAPAAPAVQGSRQPPQPQPQPLPVTAHGHGPLALSRALAAADGANRGRGVRLIDADDDLAAADAWLRTVRAAASPRTLAAYRAHIERFLLFAQIERRRSLAQLTVEDLAAWREFLRDPQPAARWVSERRHPRAHPHWRPFSGPLAASSAAQAITVVGVMLQWLAQCGYLAANPMLLMRAGAAGARRDARPRRLLPAPLWQRAMRALEQGPPPGVEAPLPALLVRWRWLAALFHLTGVRISEAAAARMGDVVVRRGADGRERWELAVTGKGDKPREVPVTEPLLQALARYRLAHGLPARPLPGETRALVLPLRGDPARTLTRAALSDSFEAMFSYMAAVLQAEGPAPEAALLRQASAHWLRHGFASQLVGRGVPLPVARDVLGHASVATTNRYLATEADARHDAVAGAQRRALDEGPPCTAD